MASPTPRDIVGTNGGTTDATSFAVTLPTHAIGDALGVCLTADGIPAISCTGWTPLVSNNAAGSQAKGIVFIKDSPAASNAEANPTFILDAGQQCSAIAFSIPSGATLLFEGSTTNGTSATPDSPGLSPSGGSQDYLWLSFAGTDNGSGVNPSAQPSGYSTLVSAANGAGTGTTSMLAYKQSTASSENPGAWAIAFSEQWAAFTVGIWSPPPVTASSPSSSLALLGVG